MSVPNLSRLVTVKEAASALGVTRQQVTSLPRAGKIPGAARIARTWLMGRTRSRPTRVPGAT